MKKALVVLLALAVVGVMGFADAKWSVSTNYGFGLGMNSSGNFLEGYDYGQVGGGTRTRLTGTIASEDGNVGFKARFQDGSVSSSPTVVINQLLGWAKLFNGMVTVKAGRLDDYTVSLGDWNCFGSWDSGSKPAAILFDVTPMAGFDIAFIQQINGGLATPNWNALDGDVVGAKFVVPNLVTVGGGAVLNLSTATAASGNAVYVFFDVKAVPGLTLNTEAQFQLFNGDTPITATTDIGYAMGPLSINAYIGEYMNKSGLDWGVEPRVSYKVNDNITVNAIFNAYTYGYQSGTITYFSPIDAGAMANGATNTLNFGGGASVNYIMGGFTLTVGDYYGAGTGQGNLFYVNADVSL